MPAIRWRLPPVSIGVFNLSNLSLGAQLNIYFTGDPSPSSLTSARNTSRFC